VTPTKKFETGKSAIDNYGGNDQLNADMAHYSLELARQEQ
jgi:hypothetical protein